MVILSIYRQQLESWLKGIDVKCNRCLDVGGSANPVKGRTKSWDVEVYRVLDNYLEKAKRKPDIVFDLNKDILKEWKKTTIQQYDVVFCLEVMEYVFDPMTALKNLNLLLVEGGILYISFPFVYPHHEPAGYDYLRYTKWGIQRLLKETGFKVEEILCRMAQSAELVRFYIKSGMHLARDKVVNHNEIGYCVRARKKKEVESK